MEKQGHPPKMGAIGTNVPKNTEEKEEDFLETIFSHWRSGKAMRLTDFAIETGENKAHLRSLAKRLVNHGYIEMTEDVITLTDIGKIRGKECMDRHQLLTQFFQMVSGMTEEEAEKDACRAEHTISRAAMEGITNFLLQGDVYDRNYSNMDLSLFFDPGIYPMAMDIYEIERRSPRILAKEWDLFEPYACLEVKDGSSLFRLRQKESGNRISLWYRNDNRWKQAASENGEFLLESTLFAYKANGRFPVTEGTVTAAVTEEGREPLTLDCREINIHVI